MLLDALELALRQMGRNLTRTVLTSLGVLIGVAAVISMVSVGQGATAAVEEDLSSFGGNLVFVVPGNQEGFRAHRIDASPFREADAEAIRAGVEGVIAVAPSLQTSRVAVREELRWRTDVRGSTSDWPVVMGFEVVEGRDFEPGELSSGSPVCLLGATVREKLVPTGPALDVAVRLGEVSCRVIGVFAAKGQNTFGMDQDDFVLVPLRYHQRRLHGAPDVQAIFVLAAPDVPSERVKADVLLLMDQRRHVVAGAERDFSVRDMAEMMAMLTEITTMLTSFLAAIGAVSLLVGGIGIMNIMLVSVTERTREIGIRLAVGARARDVLLQFLVESVVLSVVGGLLGVAAALGISAALAAWLEVPLVFDLGVVALALGVSGLVGVVFGFWPARRAARLKPIDALRHE